MEQASNEIRSTLSASIKSPIEILNLTGSAVTTAKIATLDHVTATDIRKVQDLYSRLGYGDCEYSHKKKSEFSLEHELKSGLEEKKQKF